MMGCLQFSPMILLALALYPLYYFTDVAVAASLCHPDDSYALLRLKESLVTDRSFDPSCDPKMNSWNKGGDCCMWKGVSCHEVSGHVIGLDLCDSCIVGTIYSDSSLFSLKHIKKLNLAYNNFNFSDILPEFGLLASLTHLNLSAAMFTGYVPATLSRLTEMVSLDLSASAHIPLTMSSQNFSALVRNLTKLRELVLFAVSLYDASPHSLMSLSPSLVSLNLMGCNLDMEFPESVFHLPNLESLTLSGNRNLKGSIPEFFNRTSPLKFLDLSGTLFSGNLPSSIGNLKSLGQLILSESNFSGAIPASIGNLAHLTRLDLSSNNITGELPLSFRHLRHLTYLGLSNNAIQGCVPDAFGNMSKLEYFDFADQCSLRQSGSTAACQLPLSIFNLTKLGYFKCPGCQLVGSLPNFITGLSKLTDLDLSHNSINGTIPPWLLSLPSLKYLDLGDNQLSGELHIPSPISSLGGVVGFDMFSISRNLSVLDLSINKHLSLNISKNFNYSLPGLSYLNLSSCNIIEFPYFINGATSLMQLDLSDNRIGGRIPKWMTNQLTSLDGLEFFDIHSNMIEGPLPIPPPNTKYFRVSNNKFTGEIQPLVCNASVLRVLDLANNSLSGNIPDCLGNFSTSLNILNLGSNTFRSTLPEFLSVCDGLEYLNVNGNLLKGLVPRSLANCRLLEVIDLGNNLIDDTFPMWMDALPNLKVLVLHQNRFRGPLNYQEIGSSFPLLQIIDLSDNSFAGHFSMDYFPKLKAGIEIDNRETEQYIAKHDYYSIDYSISLTFKGVPLTLEKIFFARTIVDFSSNKFSGEIPDSIGKLVALEGLNLSHNHLEGEIPKSIANLKGLEWLDLASNNLTGTIPVQLTKLTSLQMLNLSYNKLEGPIPQGKQFYTFASSSYEGNSRLCGFPLSRKCIQDQENPPPQSTFKEEDSWDGFSWITISIGYGCGTVFGIFMGHFLTSKGLPKWIVRMDWRERPTRNKLTLSRNSNQEIAARSRVSGRK